VVRNNKEKEEHYMATTTKRSISSYELRRKYDTWMRNFKYGIEQLVNEDENTQKHIYFILLQECLYNKTTSPFLSQMYQRDEDFYKVDNDGADTQHLDDYQLAPLLRKKLLEAIEEVITGGGRKKFRNVISKIKQSQEVGAFI
tara:strand:+ start:533 stop:961 length:429 start_codon:yes stop_codon:yes gene_type:complete